MIPDHTLHVPLVGGVISAPQGERMTVTRTVRGEKITFEFFFNGLNDKRTAFTVVVNRDDNDGAAESNFGALVVAFENALANTASGVLA